MGLSHLLPVFSVIACITALQSIVIFVVVILVVCMYHKRKDTPRAANTTSAEVEEQLYEAVEVEEKRRQRQHFEVKNNESYVVHKPSK